MPRVRSNTWPVAAGQRNLYINQNTPIGSTIGYLSDERGGMTPHYFLGKEDIGYKEDNEYFILRNNKIILNTSLDFETKSSYGLSYNGTGARDLALSMGPGAHWDLKITVNNPGSSSYDGKFEDYLVRFDDGTYQLERKRGITRDGIVLAAGQKYKLNGVETHQFDDVSIDLIDDVKTIYDQITGIEIEASQIFRLYEATFDRFPDTNGFQYWVDQYVSGQNSTRTIAKSFLNSDEFQIRYGENISNEDFVELLYENALNRDYDEPGYEYWVGKLNNGLEERYEVILGFAESEESKDIFGDITGLDF